MNREALKTFFLVVLVGISLLLSYALWTYQPNYESLYDPDYVSETDVGGKALMVSEVIQPDQVIFRAIDKVYGFKHPVEQNIFFKDLATWVLYDVQVEELDDEFDDGQVAEITFPNAIPAEMLPNLFSFNEDVEMPLWSFDEILVRLNVEAKSLEVNIISVDKRQQIVGTIDKTETYSIVANYFNQHYQLQEYASLDTGNGVIYLPSGEMDVISKTLVASVLKPEPFFNALFPNPSIVTPNMKEAYFTDGTRGVRVFDNGRSQEFINPFQTNYERRTAMELISHSVNHINDHKGWTNDFMLEEVNQDINSVVYRLAYDGYPVFSSTHTTSIEEQWRDNELFQYTRTLIKMGNVLNSEYVSLPSGEDVIHFLQENKDINLEKIKRIKIAYTQNFISEAHSVVMVPNWYMLYDGQWKRINYLSEAEQLNLRGGG